jgi:multidrug resistance protein
MLNKPSLPRADQPDENLTGRLTGFIHHQSHYYRHDTEKRSPVESETEPLYVEFEKEDIRDPVQYPNLLKWTITLVGCGFAVLAGSTVSSYNMGFTSMMRDINCTTFQATIGLAVYALGIGVVPLFSTSFSEEVGRRPLYIASLIGNILTHLMIALSKNIQTVIIARFLGGGFASTGAIMVAGTIADIWRPHERSLPMSIYSLAAVGSIGLGPVPAGWIEMNSHLQWRWIQWIHMILTGVILILVIVVMKETRSTIILTRLAKKLRIETGNHRYRARAEDEVGSLRTLLYISCTRPLYLLFTELTLLSISIWVGFAWGIMYCLIGSIGPIFQDIHGFNQGQIGFAFLGILIGSFFGFLTNIYQENLYQKNFPKRGPEARLYVPCVAGVFFPIGMFIYAWSSFPKVHWIWLMIGMVVFAWASFTFYLAVFTYLADCYGPFASSASAGQSLFRNLMATAFPLFTEQMFEALTYKWGNTLFGLVAVILLPIPFVFFFYGARIRACSKFSRMVLEQETK